MKKLLFDLTPLQEKFAQIRKLLTKSQILAYIIFILTSSLLTAQQTYNLEVIFQKTHETTSWFEAFGISLSSAGDINRDGYDDILIGSPSGDVRGRCYIYYGGNPMDTFVDMTFYGDSAGDSYAISVNSGYINNDTLSDIIVGIPNGWRNALQPGKVYIYYGGSGLDTIPDMILYGQNHTESFGCSIACGDINGDGFQDLIVGARYYPNTFVIHGRVYVYYGGPLLDTIPDKIINGHGGEAFGVSVGSGGDLNGDGYEDLVVGADENSEAYPGAGKVSVFFGGNPMDTIPDCWLHGEGPSDWLGWFNVDIIKNVTLNDQLITGSRMWDGNSYGRGKIYILNGGNPMDTIPDFWMIGANDSSSLGQWCSSTGYIDGDSYAEGLAGAPNDYGFLGTGYCWRGDSSMDTISDAYLRGDSAAREIGWRVASAGDVNGDGRDEVMFSNYAIMGEPATVWVCRYTGPGIEEGSSTDLGTGNILWLYPNPVRGLLRISTALNSSVEAIDLNIYDISGREVSTGKLNKKHPKLNINTEEWPAGVYFVKVRSGDRSSIQKVIKVK